MPEKYTPHIQITCPQCGVVFSDYASDHRVYCSRKCTDDARSTRDRIGTQGYRMITVDGRRVYEHRHIWEQAHGPIPYGFQVHHLDGDKTHNVLPNLELLSDVDHGVLHARRVDRGMTTCQQCGQQFTRRIQGKNLFCSSPCHSAWMKGRPRP